MAIFNGILQDVPVFEFGYAGFKPAQILNASALAQNRFLNNEKSFATRVPLRTMQPDSLAYYRENMALAERLGNRGSAFPVVGDLQGFDPADMTVDYTGDASEKRISEVVRKYSPQKRSKKSRYVGTPSGVSDSPYSATFEEPDLPTGGFEDSSEILPDLLGGPPPDGTYSPENLDNIEPAKEAGSEPPDLSPGDFMPEPTVGELQKKVLEDPLDDKKLEALDQATQTPSN